MLEKIYNQLNKYLIKTENKMDLVEIKNQEKRLGIAFPEAMVDFYEYYGNNKEVLNSFYIFDTLNEICIENNALTFGYTHQYQSRLGIPLEKLNSNFQSINFYLSDFQKWYSEGAIFPESFFFNIAGWQILNTLPAMARIRLNNEEFCNLIEKHFTYFSDDKKIMRGYKIFTLHRKDVLGCYLRDDEEFYVASKEDENLEDLENILNIQLDWI